jgi:glycopeptide antibiotics resistance protein
MTMRYVARIVLVAGILCYMGCLITIPAERLHFVEYALLGLAIERVLRHYIKDAGRPFLAMLFAYFIGLGDETIQWLLPNRYAAIRDVFLNGWGSVLGILLIPWPQQNFTSSSHRLILVMVMIGIMLSVLFVLGTRDLAR